MKLWLHVVRLEKHTLDKRGNLFTVIIFTVKNNICKQTCVYPHTSYKKPTQTLCDHLKTFPGMVVKYITWQEMKYDVCCVRCRCCARAAQLSGPGARVAAEQAAAVIAAG